MAKITPRANEPFEITMKRFKNLVDKTDIIRTYCDKQFYEKPSIVRKRNKALAIKRHQRKLVKEVELLASLRPGYKPPKRKNRKLDFE